MSETRTEKQARLIKLIRRWLKNPSNISFRAWYAVFRELEQGEASGEL